MQQFSKYKYLLMATDVFSKYGWIRPSKDKKGETVSEAFKTIFKEGREPPNLWVDKGKEFYIKHLKELLEKITQQYTQQKMKKNPMLLKDGIKQ